MPLPVMHSFAGYSLYRLCEKDPRRRNWKFACLLVFLANLADLDLLPGLFIGKATLFHRGFSHSIGAAFICAVLITLFVIARNVVTKPACRTGRQSQLRDCFASCLPAGTALAMTKIFLLSFCAYFSHAVLDSLCGPVAPIPLLWPFSDAAISTPVAFYASSDPSLHLVTSIQGLFHWFLMPRTMRLIFYEMAIVFAFLAIVTLIQDSRKGIHPKQSRALVRFAQALIFFTGFVVT